MTGSSLRLPPPSRTRVFPSSAIHNWSKSETSDVDWGRSASAVQARARRGVFSLVRHRFPTPLPSPPPQGGGDSAEFAGVVDLNRLALQLPHLARLAHAA